MALPDPNVYWAASGDKLDAQRVGGMICNPIYAGVGPFPRLLSDEEWIKGAMRFIKKEGGEQFLVNLLFVLRETFKQATPEEGEDNPAKILMPPPNKHDWCPCGSRKKFGKCCGLERVVPMNDEALEAMKRQKEAFQKKFGREPGPGDPLFFDPRKDEPVPIDEDYVKGEIVAAMKKAGISPEYVYAYEKVGVLVTEENHHLVDPEDLQAFEKAVREFRKKQRT